MNLTCYRKSSLSSLLFWAYTTTRESVLNLAHTLETSSKEADAQIDVSVWTDQVALDISLVTGPDSLRSKLIE